MGAACIEPTHELEEGEEVEYATNIELYSDGDDVIDKDAAGRTLVERGTPIEPTGAAEGSQFGAKPSANSETGSRAITHIEDDADREGAVGSLGPRQVAPQFGGGGL